MTRVGKNKRHQRGSALFSVLVVLSVVILLTVSLLGVVEASRSTVVTRYKQEQAHYSAESALSAVVSYVTNSGNAGSSLISTIKSLPVGSFKEASASLPDTMAEACTVKIEKLSANQVKIISSARYMGQTETASVVMQFKEEAAPVFEGFFTSTGKENRIDNSGWTITGDAYFYDDSLTLPSRLNIQGSLMNQGDLILQNNPQVNGEGDIRCGGNLTLLTENVNLGGDIWVKGNLESYCRITAQNIYVGGNFNQVYNKDINSNLYIAGDLNVPAGQSVTFKGKVVVSGKVNAPIASFAQGYLENQPDSYQAQRAEKTTVASNYAFWDEKKFSSLTSPAIYNIKLGVSQKVGDGYAPSHTISQSGILNTYECREEGRKLTFDTTGGDIYLTIPRSAAPGGTFSFDKGISVDIVGDHNVFILLKDDLSFRASQYSTLDKIGSLNSSGQPKLFLISSSDNAVFDFTGVSKPFNGYIYAPKATFKVNGGTFDYLGGIVMGAIQLQNTGARFTYIPPDRSIIENGVHNGIPIGGGGSGGTFSITPVYYGR